MAGLTIQLPQHAQQTPFNMRRWAEVLADPEMAKWEGRIETDRYGHVLMSPPPAFRHSRLQARIAILLNRHMADGEALTECPISTADGVRAADVAWASPQRVKESESQVCFSEAPEICVEVISPGNAEPEIRDKIALYFDAGAQEVWLCGDSGGMQFFASADNRPIQSSELCPDFPGRIELG